MRRAAFMVFCRLVAARDPGFQLVNNAGVPDIAGEFERAFEVAHSLPCDVPLGSHPAMLLAEQQQAAAGRDR